MEIDVPNAFDRTRLSPAEVSPSWVLTEETNSRLTASLFQHRRLSFRYRRLLDYSFLPYAWREYPGHPQAECDLYVFRLSWAAKNTKPHAGKSVWCVARIP
jgi:hypothetical protein